MKKHVKCPKCGLLKTVRNGTRKVGGQKVKRFFCKDCSSYFCLRINPGTRINYHQKVEITRTHIEGRTSIRTIA